MILHAMSFIDDHVLPGQFGQDGLVLDDVLVGGQQDVELDGPHLILHVAAHNGRSFVADDVDGRRPFLELERPIGQRRQGHDDEERSVILLGLDEVRYEGYRLDRFAQTHFVGQDSVEIVVVQRHQPLQTLHLVFYRYKQQNYSLTNSRISIYSTLAKFMNNVLLPTDLLFKTENSKAFIYLRVRAIIFLKNELYTELN